MNIDSNALPKVGNKVRIRIRENLWMYCQVEKIAPSMTFMTLKVLGMKEMGEEEDGNNVGEPTRLVDPLNPTGPLERDPSIPMAARRRSRADSSDLPPSPALIVEESERSKDEPELF